MNENSIAMMDLFTAPPSLKNLFPIPLNLFEADEIDRLQARISIKQVRGKEIPYVRCIIRNKEVQLKAEEVVRQLLTDQLIYRYQYLPANIRFEYPVSFGRDKKFADIVLFEQGHPDIPYIIIETKKPKLKDGKDQLKSYCHATGAPIAVWTNGKKISFYHRKNPNYFEDISDLPKSNESLADILNQRWTLEDLQKNDKLFTKNKSLKELILEMEDEVLANAGVDVFEELFKLIFTKLYDEMQSGRNKKRYLEFRNDGNSEGKLREKMQNLFNQAKQKWQGVFELSSKLELTSSHLDICVAGLQDVKLFNSNLEVIDEAFEYLINQSAKGAKGQYFTPRYVIDLCVKMLNPKANEKMIDTAAGSCGFPMHCTFHVWDGILKELGIAKHHFLSAENKPAPCIDYVTENVFAIDFDEKAVRVARTMNLIAGDGQTNVLHLNTLDWKRWEERLNDEDWQATYGAGWHRLRRLRSAGRRDNKQFNFDLLMANPPFAGDIKEGQILSLYELANNVKGKRQSKIGRDILFIERNLDFLKPGGRMAIVLPQGRFNNSSDAHIRKWLAEHGRILAVVGLHGNVFKPHTGTKTSVLFLQKWTDDNGINPRRDDYPIFFATMQKPSKDNSGEKIYLKDENGKLRHDTHGHLMVDHDLFNHEGLTQDGIFEAFVEFAKKEKLSFFLTDGKAFDPQRYQALLERLEAKEILLSKTITNKDLRLDSQFWATHLQRNPHLTYKKISDILEKSQYGISIEMNEEGKGFPIYRMNEIHDMLCDLSISKCANIESIDAATFFLEDSDVLFNRTNSYEIVGRTGIFYKNPNAAKKHIFASYLVRFTPKTETILPEYLASFLNTKYAIQEIRSRARQSINQTNVNPEEIKEIEIPILEMTIQEKIQNRFKQAFLNIIEAGDLYNQAQSLLLSELDLNNYQPNQENTVTLNLKDSFGQSGRLDAEYYQPKYDELLAKLKHYLNGYGTLKELCKMRTVNITPNAETEYQYIEISNIGNFGEITGYTRDTGNNLPTRARYQVKINDVLLSSIEGSLSSIAIVPETYHDAFCSTGFYPLYSETINSETLLLFFKSIAGQMQLQRGCNGTILTAINTDELSQVIIPNIAQNIQIKLQQAIQQSFYLRTTAKHLLDSAKTAVEIAIEQDEAKAIAFLQKQQDSLSNLERIKD